MTDVTDISPSLLAGDPDSLALWSCCGHDPVREVREDVVVTRCEVCGWSVVGSWSEDRPGPPRG